MRSAHDQAAAFKVDKDGLHGLRRDERRPRQAGIRHARIAENGQQRRVLRRRDAHARQFGADPLAQAMLRDLQVVADPIGPRPRRWVSRCGKLVVMQLQ